MRGFAGSDSGAVASGAGPRRGVVEAERAARELLVRYPEVHDGHDRLGMVYEARGMPREAAQCYRQVVEFMHANADNYDPESLQVFCELIARLDPSPSVG